MKYKDILIDDNCTITDALSLLDRTSRRILFVVKDGRLFGALSDGDIRRFLLHNGDLSQTVFSCANTSPKFLFDNEREKAQIYMQNTRIEAVPIVNDSFEIIDVEFIYDKVDLSNIIIRELLPGDTKLITDFFDQMAGDTRAMFNRGDCNRNRVNDFLCGKNKSEKHFCATVTVDGKEEIVGYVFMWDTDTKIPWIGIAVHEKWKGCHLGRMLINHIEYFAVENGYGGMMLTTVFANIRAQSLYTRMGFEFIGTHTSGEFFYIKRFGNKGGEKHNV